MPGAVPELSIVIPTHNRRDLLRRCLEALRTQTQDPETFEVIVVDDGSTDGSADVAEGIATPFRLRVLRLEKRGMSGARNAGVEVAGGPICLFLDDDVVASPELVAEHLAAHRAGEPIIGIGALTQAAPAASDWYAHAYVRAWNDHCEQLSHETPTWRDCYGCNLSVARSTLLEVSGFSEDFPTAQDTELAFRLWQHGSVPTYLPAAKGVHDDGKQRGRMLHDAYRMGADSISIVATHPSALHSRLGHFSKPGLRSVALRRALLSLRIPPRLLAAPGRLIPGQGRKQEWFHFVSRYAFWLGVRRTMPRRRWTAITRGIPVLMYHAFSDGGERDRYTQPKRSFARQMTLLRALRYRVIPLGELVEAVQEGRDLPRHAVVLTADDGYEDNLRIARPILRRLDFPATVFLVSQRLGGSNEWSGRGEGAIAGRPLMSPEQAKRAQESGLEFGAHTRLHRSLPDAGDAVVQEEVKGSRDDLEALLPGPVSAFAYPYGYTDERAVAAVRDSGFEVGLVVDDRRATIADDLMQMPRIEVRGTDSLARFLCKLWFGSAH
jgi:glycosyltransferase involved in cell wall biosynthesis/peptidoglycan/xylan/chitin deacetylase (PgdA/CDA1 family)